MTADLESVICSHLPKEQGNPHGQPARLTGDGGKGQAGIGSRTEPWATRSAAL